jgi:long-chain fatty acid transport protein
VPSRSEVGVGRLIAPIAFNVNDQLTIGGSLDYVWAMMDLQMVATAAQVLGMTGGLDITGFGADSAYLSFSDNSDYTGKAKGAGFAGKLGLTYKVSPTFTVGATYHSKTNMGDLETGANGASFGLYAAGLALGPADVGKFTVRDFQWPETYGMGMAWQATPKLMVAADVKHIGWSEVMKNFQMTYSSVGFGTVNMTMPQNWDDQTVYSLGFSYAATNALTLRAGANVASNPIPSATLNPLFPAIVEDHYTVGLGYAFNPSSDLNVSVTIAPEVTQVAGSGVTSTHGQTSWQLMYSKRF